MASVTVALPSNEADVFASRVSYALPQNSRLSLGSSLSINGSTELFFAYLDLPRTESTVRLRLSASQAVADPNVAGPEFSDQMESAGTIHFVASNGSTLTITGISDATEPYQWSPSNLTAIKAFAEAIVLLTNRALTVTFDDNAAGNRAPHHNSYRRESDHC